MPPFNEAAAALLPRDVATAKSLGLILFVFWVFFPQQEHSV